MDIVLTWQVVAGVFITLSPVTSYLDTLLSIKRRKTSAGFSLDVCAIMLVASICKIYFYFGRPYELSLLLQAVIMVGIQVALLHLALKYRPRQWAHGPLDRDTNVKPVPKAVKLLVGDKVSDDGNSKRPFAFWEWEEEAPYWNFLIRLTGLLGVLQLMVGRWSWYVEIIGLAGLMIEAVLPLPQIYTIYTRQSVDGFRISLLVSWLGGDISKLIYLSTTSNVAPQFIVCAAIQACFDSFIAFQYFMYTTGRWTPSSQATVKVNRQRAQSIKLQGIQESKVTN